MSDRIPPLSFESHGLEQPSAARPSAPGPAPLVLVLIGGLVATLVLVFLVTRLEERSARADLLALAEQRFTLLDANLDRALDSLVSVGAYFDTSSEVSRWQFASLVKPTLQRQPAIKALEWVPYTPAFRLDALRASVRAEGFPDFDIRELGEGGKLRSAMPRAEYFPVSYVEPIQGNERAFGFDLGSNPVRFQALDAARRQGRMLATARITLVQEQGRQFGFLVIRPVYRHAGEARVAAATELLPPDPETLRGYVLGVFRLSELIGLSEAQKHGRMLDIYVFDELGRPGETLLFPGDAPVHAADELVAAITARHDLTVAGRVWTVIARPQGGVLRVDRTASVIVAVAGLLLTLLLAQLQQQNRGRTQAIEQMVEARTADLRESERRLIQANFEAVQANRLKTMFLASMSHEFRTPMNAILGLLHVLGRTPMESGQRDYLEKISSAARRLLRLIDDILDVSRIEAGKLSVEREPFRIEAVLRDVLVAVAPKLRDKAVEMVLDVDPTLPGHLLGDGMRLTQVLVNLADNAAKFTQEGDITLSVGWTAESEQRLRLNVELRDTGQGMSEQDLRAVFLPFVQTENTHRRKHGGTGLGLAICRQLVTLMGGEIQVESSPGKGSRFWFDVPLELASPAPLVSARTEEQAPAVLVLDPHPDAARTLCRLIAAFGSPVRSASDPRAAADWLALERFDLVLASQGFALERMLESVPLARRPGRVLRLLGIGASLHGGDATGTLEKPLLPALLAAVLFPVEHEQAAMADPALPTRQALLHPAPPVLAPSARVLIDIQGHGNAMPSDLRILAQSLRDLLVRGDPEAEVVARDFARRAQATPHAAAAADLQRQCSNFDFREALAALDILCPPASRQQS